jgi:hypothetical protein
MKLVPRTVLPHPPGEEGEEEMVSAAEWVVGEIAHVAAAGG